MPQLKLFKHDNVQQVVNVASVPQRSPFRYPGGKTWLIPRIRLWLNSLESKPPLLIEPFAGGGIVSLSAIFDGFVDHVLIVELDEHVASVWQTILSEDAQWLIDQILHFTMSYDSLMEELNKEAGTLREKAFRTLLRNRTSHGGILAPGAGLIKNGESGKGVLSRWYPGTLAKRIWSINRFRDKISFIHGDGFEVIRAHTEDISTVFFVDPPYTAAGKKAGTRLYCHSALDHELLFSLMNSVCGDFLMTYDNTEEIEQLAQKHGFKAAKVAMNNTHHAKLNELLISKNLDWLR